MDVPPAVAAGPSSEITPSTARRIARDDHDARPVACPSTIARYTIHNTGDAARIGAAAIIAPVPVPLFKRPDRSMLKPRRPRPDVVPGDRVRVVAGYSPQLGQT